MMQKETACFPVLCPTQISSTTANFIAEEGRKHDSKVSAMANTVEGGGKNQSACLRKLELVWLHGVGVDSNDT